MPLFSFGWRYEGTPKKDLYGLQALIDKRAARDVEALGGLTRETCQLVVDIARSSWSVDSPASAGDPPGINSGNLDSAARVYERDLSGRFSGRGEAKVSSIIWDTTKGSSYHGRGEYAAVQEYGLDGLNSAHPFLAPAIAEVENGFFRRVKGVFNGGNT